MQYTQVLDAQLIPDEKDTELVSRLDVRAGVISIDPERHSGTPCFAGTRVPIQDLWDYLEGGDSLDSFLESFPSVSREQALKVMHLAAERLLEGLPTR
jgi:uncharacterized protein (DUF433 family)